MKYKLNYDCANVELVGTDECIGFDTFSDAKDFVENNKEFELYIAEYNCHQPNEGWNVVGKAYEPLSVRASDYGDNYHLISSVDDAEDYCRSELSSMIADGNSIIYIANYADKAADFVSKVSLLEEGCGLVFSDVSNTEEVRIDCAFFDDNDGHYTRIVAVRKN